MKKQFAPCSRRWIGLVVLVSTLFSLPVVLGSASGATVSLSPSSSQVNVGATTTVNIRVASVTSLYGAEVHLTFNPALLEVVDSDGGTAGVQIQPGTFLSADFTAQNVVDQAAGKIDFAVAQMPPNQPVSGDGVLATITFKGRADGSSNVGFVSVILSDRDGMAIGSSTQGGSVTVGAGGTPVPTVPVPTTQPPPSGNILGYHVVQSGENLFCIGRAYGVDPYAIASQNGILNPNVVVAGQSLAIPNVPKALPAGRTCARQFGDGGGTPTGCRYNYTVVAGDTLHRISLQYGVSVYAIAQASGISNVNLIFVGQVLCIP